MEIRALILALSLTLPLAAYGIPYAYASSVVTTYTVLGPEVSASPGQHAFAYADCRTGDVATGGGHFNIVDNIYSNPIVLNSGPEVFDGFSHSFANTGQTANSWRVDERGISSDVVGIEFGASVECMSPVTVAGIGVPQFGSLYVAIALGALVYLVLAKRHARRPLAPIRNMAT
jgi:hypothetical protein